MSKHARVHFDSREFEFSHGKAPRGRGQWFFFTPDETDHFSFNGTFSEARKAARQWAQECGYEDVIVGA